MLTTFFVLLFVALKPPSRIGVFFPWAMVWMGLVWLVWTLFRLEPARIAVPPILKWNQVKTKINESKTYKDALLLDKDKDQ